VAHLESKQIMGYLRLEGGIDLLMVDLGVDAWTRLIVGGVAQEAIRLPNRI
jgi:hypothetical protein